MKRTLLFSNLDGDIFSSNRIEKCKFNKHMEEYLKNNLETVESLIFIDAPGFGNEDKFFETILSCFAKIGIKFNRTLYVSKNTNVEEIKMFDKTNCIYFLMSGYPMVQYEIIVKNNLIEEIRNYNGLVIGFCAGTINLSKYSLVTTDNDLKRNNEIIKFVSKYDTEVIALPDESIVVVEEDNIIELGANYHFKK